MTETSYTMQQLAGILNPVNFVPKTQSRINQLLIDSRKVMDPEHALFFAVKAQRDGHEFIADAYAAGVRKFVISDSEWQNKFPEASFLVVSDVITALQQIAAAHRSVFKIPVIGITGSNGKTIVKEWLAQLLNADYKIVRSPKSFNSQIGVPLSVWQMNSGHTLGIFEAGISRTGEMAKLAGVLQPTIGILTNLGEAHAEGFSGKPEKLSEKLRLFDHTDLFIYSPDYTSGLPAKSLPGSTKFSWSFSQPADLQITGMRQEQAGTTLDALYQGTSFSVYLPFKDRASLENGVICWSVLLALGYEPAVVKSKLSELVPVNMRLSLKNGINQCSIIDDSYSADTSSLAIALDFLKLQKQHDKKTVILSDLHETGRTDTELYAEIAAMLSQKEISRLVGIGPHIKSVAELFDLETVFFDSTADFISAFPQLHFSQETILVKGARKFGFEQISKLLTQKVHDTIMEIDLNAIAHNLRYYQTQLSPGVKLMAMVKAFSYGSGSFEIANLLQYHQVDYLTVAYADEGIALRKSGITLPIMVMSPEPSAFEAMLKYKLEPELYSFEILNAFISFLPQEQKDYPVHLKVDTGMRRLGFEEPDLPVLLKVLKDTGKLKVISAFSHLAGSEDELHEEFTLGQIGRFKAFAFVLRNELGYDFIRHICNTSAITRYPDAQFEMVRLGIGLYGFDSGKPDTSDLQVVAKLKTTVTQVKRIAPGETVGYGRRGILPQGGQIATVKIGYADGYRRSFGNGIGMMLVNGKPARTIGAIAMDMCMLDVTGIDVHTDDEVIVFNEELTIVDLAAQIGTIPYEILTNISQRVKRIYFYE